MTLAVDMGRKATKTNKNFFCGSFLSLMSCVFHAFPSVHCCLVVTFWERANLLALVCDVYCAFVNFHCGILGQVWYLIVSFPEFCFLSNFYLLSLRYEDLVIINFLNMINYTIHRCVLKIKSTFKKSDLS